MISVFECVPDDSNVVYRFTTPGLPGPKNHAGLAMVDKNGGATSLIAESYTTVDMYGVPNMAGQPTANGKYSYGIAGDWVFFWSNRQIWQRDPNGAITAATALPMGTNMPWVMGMAPMGEMLVGGSPDGGVASFGLHRVPAGATLSGATLVHSEPFGVFGTGLQPVWRGGRWILIENDTTAGALYPKGGAWLFNDGMNTPFDCAPVIMAPDGGVDAALPADDGGAATDSSVPVDASTDGARGDGSMRIDSATAMNPDGGDDGGMPGGCNGCNLGARRSGGGTAALLLMLLGLAAIVRTAARRKIR